MAVREDGRAHLLTFQVVWKCPGQQIYEHYCRPAFNKEKLLELLQNKTKTNRILGSEPLNPETKAE